VIALISLAYLAEDGLLLALSMRAAVVVLTVASAAVWGAALGASWIGRLLKLGISHNGQRWRSPCTVAHMLPLLRNAVSVLVALFALTAIASSAEGDGPERVRPSTGTIGKLREASTSVADTFGEYLDAGHDWLYRRLQHLFEDVDLRFASPDQAPILVPLSPLRIDFDGEFLHRKDGLQFAATPNFEATLRLPNL